MRINRGIKMAQAAELNIDALPGLTHHYGGHALGNLPSMQNKERVSHPKQAALQSLEKMRMVHRFGTPQMVFPPHFRPSITTLQEIGFSGGDEQIVAQAVQQIPEVYYKLCSSAGMWMANAATVSAASDTQDQKIHFTPANLASSLHRCIEASFISKLLKKAFPNPQFFVHHEPLPFGQFFSDEGAANLLRLSLHFDISSLSIFSWGRKAFGTNAILPKRFPARQALEASEAIARQHSLNEKSVLFVQQSPEAIDAGCFHLDLSATAHKTFLLMHEKSLFHTPSFIEIIQSLFSEKHQKELIIRKVAEMELSLSEALDTFLFNSQFITDQNGKEILLCSNRCRENGNALRLLQELVEDPAYPVQEIQYLDLSESLLGGGGPGCLRLRVPLSSTFLDYVHKPLLFTDTLYERLKRWIEEYYPDALKIEDLSDPELIQKEKEALDTLTKTLQLGSIYSFQQT